MDLRWDQVRSVVRSSGTCARVEYWVGKRAPSSLKTTTVRINLPAEWRERIPTLWAKLQGGPWFAGI